MRKINFLPAILIGLLVLLLDLYVFQGVKVLSAGASGVMRQLIRDSYWLISAGLVILFLATFYKSIVKGRITLVFNTVFNAFLTLFVTKLVFVLVLFLEDSYRFITSLIHGSDLPERSVLLSQAALFISAVPFFAFLFGVTRGKYHYKVRKTVLYFDELPEAFNGFKIAQISDIHAGSFDNREAVQKGVNLIQAQNADVILFTGDLVNNLASEIVPWMDMFKALHAPHGKFSVLGNHDYGDYIRWKSGAAKAENLDTLKKYHHEMGFRLLLDEHLKISRAGQYIDLLGVENWGLGFGLRGDLSKALSGVAHNSFKILLSHDPTHWEGQVRNHQIKIHLTLSGHTHGMQFGIEALGIKWSPVKYRYPHWAGLKEENGRFLYINRGFGFLGFSGRIGIWPEITLIELRRGKH